MKSKLRSFRRLFVEQLEIRRVLASDYLLEIDGIKGESKDKNHPGAIELSSFSWGASQPSFSGPADPLTAQEFRFVTDVSQASPALFATSVQGKHLTSASLFVRKPGESQQEYLKIKLSDVMVSSVQSRSLNEGLPQEEISFNFTKIRQEYRATNPDGSLAPPTIASWEIKQNANPIAPSASLLSKIASDNIDATDAFLEISGIKGESTDKIHKETIYIESWSFGATQSQTGGGGGAGAGKVSMQDFHFVTTSNNSSPVLASTVVSGKHLTDAVLTVRRNGPGGNADFLKIKLQDILVSSYQTKGSSNSAPMEEFTFNFSKLSEEYLAQKPDGTFAPAGSVSWSSSGANAPDTRGVSILDTTVPVPQQSDIFLNIDGIQGESTDKQHKDWIAIDSYSWGISQQGSGGGGGGAGKVNVQDFSFVSAASQASPALMSKVASGKHIASATLAFHKLGTEQDYLKYKLADLQVNSIQTQSINESVPTDSFSLNFSKIEYKYSQQNAAGLLGAPVTFSWNVPASAERVHIKYIPSNDADSALLGAVDYLLEIDGIKGESTDQDHKGAIALSSFSWGASNPSSSGGGGGAGKVNMQDFHFVSAVNQASPQLIDATLSGNNPNTPHTATLFVRKRGDHPTTYLKYELKNVMVSSYAVRSLNNAQPLEEFTMSFGELDATESSQSPDGSVFEAAKVSLLVTSADHKIAGPSILDLTKAVPGAFDFFLDVSGIKGDSTSRDHKDKIDIQSFSWGVSQSQSVGAVGGAGAGKVSMQDFHFVMNVSSSATPALASAMASGKHLDSAILSVGRRGSDKAVDFLKYKLEDIILSSYRTQGTEGSTPQEEVSFNFTKFEQQYRTQDARGSFTEPVTVDWSNDSAPARFSRGKSILSMTASDAVAHDFFLAIDGIKGESTDQDHKGSIELSSFSWGMSRRITSRNRGGIGELRMEDFHFTVNVSKASPTLFFDSMSGKHHAGAQLKIRKSGGKFEDYLTYKLGDVQVSSYRESGNGAVPLDQFSLNFSKITINDFSWTR